MEPCLQGDVQMSLLVSCLSGFPGGCTAWWALAVAQRIREDAHVLFTLLVVGGLKRKAFPLPFFCGKKNN